MLYEIDDKQRDIYIRAVTRYELLKKYVKELDTTGQEPDMWYLRLLTKEDSEKNENIPHGNAG